SVRHSAGGAALRWIGRWVCAHAVPLADSDRHYSPGPGDGPDLCGGAHAHPLAVSRAHAERGRGAAHRRSAVRGELGQGRAVTVSTVTLARAGSAAQVRAWLPIAVWGAIG